MEQSSSEKSDIVRPMNMNGQKILINGQPTDLLSAFDRGLQYGDGVFETIAVKAGEPLALEEHLIRLSAGAKTLGFPAIDISQLMDDLSQVVSPETKSILKIILTRGIGGRGYRSPGVDTVPTRILSSHPWPDYNRKLYKRGIRLTLCETRLGHNPRLAGIKHLNRLEQVLARDEWSDAEILEGVMLDTGGYVIAGTMSNLFLVRGERLLTPALEVCGIHGVIRKLVLDAAAQNGLDCELAQISTGDLHESDEIFICNSVLGLCHVREFLETTYNQSSCTEFIREVLVRNNKILSP